MRIILVVLLISVLATGCAVDRPTAVPSAGGSSGHEHNTVVVDVRTPEEFAAGHVPSALNVPVSELEEKISTVVPDKSTPITVYCQSGRRSAAARSILEKMGYREIQDLGSFANAKKKLPDR